MALVLMSLKDRVARSVFWIVWSRALAQLLSFASTLLVARILSPVDYGLMAMAGAWTAALILVTELGLGAAVVQFPDLSQSEMNTCFWGTVIIACAIYAGLYAVGPWIEARTRVARLSSVLRVLGVILPLAALRMVPEGLLRKRLQLDRLAKTELAARLAGIPLLLGLAYAGAGVWALVGVSVFVPFVMTVCWALMAGWWPGMRVGSARLHDLIRFSAGTLGTRVGAAVYQQSDAVILGAVSGDMKLGLFSMAKSLALIPVEKVSGAVNEIALPVMAELQADRGALRASFLRGLRLVACVTFPACVGMALTAGDVVSVGLGAKWMPAVPILQVLCVHALVRSVDVLVPPVLMARYRTTFLFWYVIGLLVVMPVAFWGGAVAQDGLGVALVWVVVYPLLMVWAARAALDELRISWVTVWTETRPVIETVAAMAGCLLLVQTIMPGATNSERAIRLGMSLVVGGAVYGLGVFWRGGAVATEVSEVFRWLVRREGAAGTSK